MSIAMHAQRVPFACLLVGRFYGFYVVAFESVVILFFDIFTVDIKETP